MLISATAQAAEQNRRGIVVDGQDYATHDYIGHTPIPGSAGYGTLAEGDGFPQAYLVIQPPHSVTRPHFHQTNQFQVFVAGGGRVGKLRADPVTVQFAGGHTPYGPIHAEADGIQYFTLRQHWDSGAKYMPDMRDSLERGRQRQRVGAVQRDAKGGAATPAGTPQPLFDAEDDGLLALHYVLPPGADARLPDAEEGGGQFHVIVGGTLLRNGAELGPLSLEFVSPEEGAVTARAGSNGLDLLLLRFPR